MNIYRVQSLAPDGKVVKVRTYLQRGSAQSRANRWRSMGFEVVVDVTDADFRPVEGDVL